MDKRKLKEYIKKVPKAILYNGSERYVVTTENLDDILIIKIFFKGKKSELARSYELAWVHFYSKTERKYISYDLLGEFRTKWLTRKLYSLPHANFFSDYYEMDSKGIVDAVNKKEEEILHDKLMDKYVVNINEFKDFNKQVRKIPKEFNEWIEKEVIKGYALYDNKQKIVECTICGNTFNNSKTFRNSELICPKCRSTLKTLPKGHFRINDEGYCAFAQLCNTGLVVRYFQWRNSRASNGNQRKFVTEYRRDFIDSNNDIKSYVYSSYKLSGYIGFIPFENRMGRMGYYGYMEPYAGFTRNAKFWFKGRKHLKNSPYEYAILSKQYQTFLYQYFVEGNISEYFQDMRAYPALETMLKNGQYNLVNAALHGYPRIKKWEPSPAKALGLSRDLMLRIADNCDHQLLEAIQFLYKAKQSTSNEIIRFLRENPLMIGDLNKLTKYNFSKIISYINQNYKPDNIRDYIDYLDCCKRLNIKMNKSNLYPQNLIAAHNEVVSQIHIERNKSRDEQYQYIKETDLKKYEQLEINDLIIRLPKNISEIIAEGVIQHNCVGALYIDRILNRRSDILFVRKKDSPEEPYVTLEIFNDRIVQCRYRYNQMCGPEITDVVEEYLSLINEKKRVA